MSKSFIDKAYAVVPEFENCTSRFDEKLRIAQYAEQSIYDCEGLNSRLLFIWLPPNLKQHLKKTGIYPHKYHTDGGRTTVLHAHIAFQARRSLSCYH